MLFNSYPFLLVFLPATLPIFFALGRRGKRRAVIAWLILASFTFYAYWSPAYLLLPLRSMAFNYVCGLATLRARGPGSALGPGRVDRRHRC
jgi:alginate O-acetyltransferase complex protein AlgI